MDINKYLVDLGVVQSEADAENELESVRFKPPVYSQRYDRAISLISQHASEITKLVDFGCAELRFVQRARSQLHCLAEICGVDVDRPLLDANLERVLPKSFNEYLNRFREVPLALKVFEGSVFDFDVRCANADAVTCIELIEHIDADQHQKLISNIFLNLRPYIVVITTPNSDFNSVFGLAPGKFRHWDHRFEWSRKQFQDWCHRIVNRYVSYDVTFDDVGTLRGHDEKGACSQLALFKFRSLEKYRKMRAGDLEFVDSELDLAAVPYRELANVTFPTKGQCQNRERKLIQQISNAAIDLANANKAQSLKRNKREGVMVSVKSIVESQQVASLCTDQLTIETLMLENGFYFEASSQNVFVPLYQYEASSSEEEEEADGSEDSGGHNYFNLAKSVC